jgi:hypothetical protein
MTAGQDGVREAFLGSLARLETWLKDEVVPHVIIGSLAVSAYVDQGASADFDRPHARDEAERMPDIDLLVPRDSLPRVKAYAEMLRHSDRPVKVDTFASEWDVDFRPDADTSYLTHRKLRFPVSTELFAPRRAVFLGQEITTVDPRTLLHLFGTVGGVIRKKDVAKIEALAGAIGSGRAVSGFGEQDCDVFSRYAVARKRQYPIYITAKQAWEGAVTALPPQAQAAIKRHIVPPAQQIMRRWARNQDQSKGNPER